MKEALKKQTFYQFQSYAQQQYPNDSAAQEQLIKSLEELHYQQFVQQIMQFQGQQQLAEPTDDLANGLQQLNLNRDPADPATASATENGLSGDLNRQLGKMNQQDYANNQRHLVDQNDSELDESEEETEDEQSEADTDNESAGYDNYEGKSVQVASPQMWCKKIIRQFKESISIDSGDCVIKVGHGETLTIRVPTVPEGRALLYCLCEATVKLKTLLTDHSQETPSFGSSPPTPTTLGSACSSSRTRIRAIRCRFRSAKAKTRRRRKRSRRIRTIRSEAAEKSRKSSRKPRTFCQSFRSPGETATRRSTVVRTSTQVRAGRF